MAQKPEEGRANIATALRDVQAVFRRRPSVYILQMFFDAKADEIVNVFSKSFPDERNRVVAILNEVDPIKRKQVQEEFLKAKIYNLIFMLTKLAVSNYALISNLEVGFHSGLNSVTGETGAGKSIILGALGLNLGKSCRFVCVLKIRMKMCIVEGFFEVG
jgi:hypothetical protein